MNALLVASALIAAMPIPSPEARQDFERGELALSSNRLEDAATAYRAAIAKAPGFASATNGLGTALYRLNRREEALELFKAAVAANPELELGHFNTGYCARKLGEFSTAVVAYENYTRLAPKDADGFYGLGESYRQTGQLQEAIGALEKFVAMSSEQKWVQRATATITALKTELANAAAAAATPAEPQATVPAVSTGPASAAPGEGERDSAQQAKL